MTSPLVSKLMREARRDPRLAVISDTEKATLASPGGVGVATQAEAVAGTENTKMMTALRVAQAIAALSSSGMTGAQIVSAINTNLGSTTWQQGGGTMTGAQIVTAIDTALGSTAWQQAGGGGGSTTVANNLTTNDAAQALSAAQGVALKALIDALPTNATVDSRADARIAAQKGANNGLASLGSDGKLATSQIPASLVGAVQYQGTWNALNHTPTIPNAAPENKGFYYIIGTAGTVNIDGINEWQVGDWIISDGTKWTKVDNTDTAVNKANSDSPVFTGIVTSSGANVVPPTAMGANAINVALMDNTKSVNADTTFTFSGTPATGQVFGLELTNSGATPRTMTIPSSFSRLRQAAITSFVLPASGRLNLFFKYDGTRYFIVGDPGPLNNFAASADPTASDDITKGYEPGSVIINGAKVFMNRTNGAGAAVWSTDLAAAGGSSTTIVNDLTSGGTTSALSAQMGLQLAVNDTKVPVNAQTGTAYTLVIDDAGKEVRMTNAAANTVTIPPNASIPFAIDTVIAVKMNGAGSTTIAAGAGVTITKPASRSLTISAQGEYAMLKKEATNTWSVVAA